MLRPRIFLLAAWALASPAPAPAAPNDWAEGTPGKDDGATRDYYNRAGLLAWKHRLGDWRDARDAEQGDAPYATATVRDEDATRALDWDVTALVREWVAGKHPNQGMLLRGLKGAISDARHGPSPRAAD